MNRARAAVVVTLVAAVALGVGATLSMRRASRRRASLADGIAARLPTFSRSRLISPWEPAPDADEAHTTYCLEDVGAAAAACAARVRGELAARSWRVDYVRPDPRSGGWVIGLTGDGYELRGVCLPGHRADCDGARGQATFTAEAVARAAAP